MPTWINHFRVADNLLDKINQLNIEYFLIGNIAPDCGIPTGKNGEYVPSTNITHFTVKDISNKTDCNYNYIYENYIKNETDIKKRSFFIGYFVHLFTDCEYALDIYLGAEKKYGKFSDNLKLWKAFKTELHNIDELFLKDNYIKSFELFKTYTGFSETYPDWYKNNEITKQMKNIVNFYAHPNPKSMNYKYITPERISDLIDDITIKLLAEFEKRGITL